MIEQETKGLIPRSSAAEATSNRRFDVAGAGLSNFSSRALRYNTFYSAASESAAREALEDFGKKWDKQYPLIYQSWDRHWEDLCEFFKYPEEIRKAIYTTNAIESLNYQLRKVTKNRLLFPTDDAIFKILYLAIRNASEKWTMPIKNWGQALHQFAIEFGNERVPF